MQKSNDKKRHGLRDTIINGMGLPSDALLGEVRIEMRGRGLMLLGGCRRILKYSAEEICFKVKGFCVTVKGGGLVCTTFHAGNVTVEGDIENITFDNGEK